MSVLLNQPAMELKIGQWLQGEAKTLAELKDKVVLVEVIQVNCPGCFLYAIPEVIRLYELFHEQGLEVLLLATAFEDYDKNNVENLQRLLDSGTVVGETQKALLQASVLLDGKFRSQMPFSVAMDRVIPVTEQVTDEKVLEYSRKIQPDISQRGQQEQDYILQRVELYLQQKTMIAETFEQYELRGTPSSILIDREGILRDVSFGLADTLEPLIRRYLSG